MPYAEIRGLDLYYEIHGSGPPLLNIGGSSGDLRVSMASKNPLNQPFTVCHYDQRGLGRTSKPDGAWSMADYADDAAELIESLGWGRAHVVGTSFGGMVAQHLAMRHPAMVERMALLCTAPGGAGGSSADFLALQELPKDERANRWLRLLDTRNDPDTGFVAPGMEAIVAHTSRAKAADDEEEEANAVGTKRQLEARAGHDMFDALPRVTTETLVLAGRFDGVAPLARSEAIVGALPNARLRIYDGGHLFMLQDAEVFPDLIEFFTAAG